VSDDVLQVTTEEQREQLHAARNHGGSCARCSRTLGDGETVYFESFLVDTRKLRARSETGSATISRAPVGIECASPELLEQTEGQAPAPCVGCGRGVYYGAGHSRRHRALCSRRCAGRANIAKRAGDQA
jgi:hypothetical protein